MSPTRTIHRAPTVPQIIRAASIVTGVAESEIVADNRERATTRARRIAVYVARHASAEPAQFKTLAPFFASNSRRVNEMSTHAELVIVDDDSFREDVARVRDLLAKGAV